MVAESPSPETQPPKRQGVRLRWKIIGGGILVYVLWTLFFTGIGMLGDFNSLRMMVMGRPDVIPPRPVSGFYRADNQPQTIYKYLYNDPWITDGSSQVFVFPSSFTRASSPSRASSAINIKFDLQTKQGWESVPQNINHPKTWDERKEKHDRFAGVTLSNGYYPVVRKKMIKAAKQRGLVRAEDLRSVEPVTIKKLHWLDKKHCGFEMFEKQTRGHPDVLALQKYPNNSASVFVRYDEEGGYERIVTCGHPAEFSTCNTREPWKFGYSLSVNFGTQHLCEVDSIVKVARDVLTKHMVKETGPTPGWGKPPGTYNEDRR